MSTHRRKIPSDPEISKRITAALEFHRIRPAQLAKMMRISPSAVSQWLSGSVTPRDEHFVLMAEVLGEDERWLQGKTVRGKRGLGAVAGRLLDKAGSEGFKYLADLPAQELQRIISEHQEKKRRTRPRGKSAKTR